MGNNVTSTRQFKAIAAFLDPGCRHIKDVAAAAGVTRKTVYRWLDDPGFQADLRKAENLVIDDVTRALLSIAHESVAVLESILRDESAPVSVRRQAARDVLDYLMRLRDHNQLVAEVDELRGMIDDHIANQAKSGAITIGQG